ncbi:MAG: 2Fe-2S iron-sulfur cluster-binding protein [Rheinheimera sp.]|nr:2Fe-2S iron-sulfur cluster-binding protein [Rheinheimera sp.]
MHRVRLQDGSSFDFDPQSPNLLTSLEQQKYQVNFHCRAGFCGACRCKLVADKSVIWKNPSLLSAKVNSCPVVAYLLLI